MKWCFCSHFCTVYYLSDVKMISETLNRNCKRCSFPIWITSDGFKTNILLFYVFYGQISIKKRGIDTYCQCRSFMVCMKLKIKPSEWTQIFFKLNWTNFPKILRGVRSIYTSRPLCIGRVNISSDIPIHHTVL